MLLAHVNTLSPPIDLHIELHDRLPAASLHALALLPCWYSKHDMVVHYRGTLRNLEGMMQVDSDT